MSTTSPYNFNPNSLDSKLTQLITNQENDQEERHLFRVQILERLDNIEKNTSSVEGRVSKIEANQKIYADAYVALKKQVEPIVDAANTVEKTWFSFKNIVLGLSFIFSFAGSVYVFFKG